MVANVRGYTDNYKFKLINFDTPRWHTLEYDNWNLLDAMLQQAAVPQVRGEWMHNTAYLVGDRVFDDITNDLYRCLVAHTSPASGTFEAFRLTNPDTWALQLVGTPLFRGAWTPTTTYAIGDITFTDDYTYRLCTIPHTSSATFPPDEVNWQIVFDATDSINAAAGSASAAAASELAAALSAEAAADSAADAAGSAVAASGSAGVAAGHAGAAAASATNAATSEGNAATSASTAAGHATNAATSETNAAASAAASAASATSAANQALALFGTSTTANTINNGAKTFTTQSGKQFNVGNFVTIVDAGNIANTMSGQVTSYVGTTLQVNITGTTGSGVGLANWNIYVSGARGINGTGGIAWKGTWNSATAYVVNDAVALLGNSYIAINNNTNSSPPSANWNLLAQGGAAVVVDDQITPAMLDADTLAKQQAFTTRINAVAKTGDTMTGPLGIGMPAGAPYDAKLVIGDGVAWQTYIGGDVVGNAWLQLDNASESAEAANGFSVSRSRGTIVAPTPIQLGDMVGAFYFGTLAPPSTWGEAARIEVRVDDGATGSAAIILKTSKTNGVTLPEERLRITSGGSVGIGTEAYGGVLWGKFQVTTNDGLGTVADVYTDGRYLEFDVASGDPLSAPEVTFFRAGLGWGAIANGYVLGEIVAGGAATPDTFPMTASIQFVVNGTPSADHAPTDIVFKNGASNPEEHLRIGSDGAIYMRPPGWTPGGLDDQGVWVSHYDVGGGLTSVIQNYTYSNGGYSEGIYFKFAHGTQNAPLPLVQGRYIGVCGWGGFDGVTDQFSAQMGARVDGPVSPGVMPLAFYVATGTTNDNIAERFRITSGGFVGIGTSEPTSPIHVSGTIADWTTDGASTGQWTYADAVASIYYLGRARGTKAAPTTLILNDIIGSIQGQGFDGVNWPINGNITFVVDGAVSPGVLPTAISLATGSTVLTERVRIGSDGKVTIPGALKVDGALTLVGPISASAPPTLGPHLTNKTYVDSQIGTRLPSTGPASFTGNLTVTGTFGVGGAFTASGNATITGTTLHNNDVTITRAGSASPTTGALFFGNAGNRYLWNDATHFRFETPGGTLLVNGAVVYTTANLPAIPAAGFTSAIYGLQNYGGLQIGLATNTYENIGEKHLATVDGGWYNPATGTSYIAPNQVLAGSYLHRWDGTGTNTSWGAALPGSWRWLGGDTFGGTQWGLWQRVG